MGKILEVKDLRTYFHTRNGVAKAVDGVSFELEAGETLGVVGESGSGKSVTMLSILGLIPTPPGRIEGGEALFKGKDLLKMNSKELRKIRGSEISMIFQDPMTSLNPYLKISKQLTEVLIEHQGMSYKVAHSKAIAELERVGIPDASKRVDHYPHQFSGGMRQRVMIAMALISNPQVLIADEPTTALDVTIQAQILALLKDLQKERGMSIILITHDLGVVANMSNKALVMYGGKPVEWGTIDNIFYDHRHPYTAGLLKSLPSLEGNKDELYSIPGLPPDPTKLPVGCAFAPRCAKAKGECRSEKAIPVFKTNSRQGVVCHLGGPA